jgi:hypothetical protein
MNKRFSRRLYEENDKKGKETAMEFLRQLGYVSLDPTEIYKAGDIQMKKNDHVYIAEVEIKSQWTNESNWQTIWPDIRIPHRKKDSEAHFYIMFNNNCSCLGMIDMEIVKKSAITQISNRYMDNEDFFSIPYRKWFFYKREEKGWTPIDNSDTK